MKIFFKILNLISFEGIILEEFDSIEILSDGIYFKIPDCPPTIGISSSIINDSKKYISTLGEELGHHFTTDSNLMLKSKKYSDKILKDKNELKAKTWASNFLITDKEFVQALNNCIVSKYEMAEYFNVTEEIINYKISSIISNEDKYMNIRKNFMLKEIQYNSCNI